jgi:DNA polymerase-3 subunit alpha
MGKKIQKEMDEQRGTFIRGAMERGFSETLAVEVFNACAKFAEYGFNKSHSAPYAYISYQTAYLKANHPVEFLAASMTLDMGNTDKLMQFKQEAVRLGIKVVAPSVNASGTEFDVREGAIIYALAALRNVGAGAVAHLVDRRQEGGAFSSMADFARRVDCRALNRRALESLAKSGAFDCLHRNRAQVLDSIDLLMGLSNRAASEQAAGQDDLFRGGGTAAVPELVLPPRDNWLPMERLANEFDAVGFYLSGHPLEGYGKALARLGVESHAGFVEKVKAAGASAARLAATVTHRQERRSRAGNRFAFVGFSDPSGQFEAICFTETLNAARDLLEPGQSVIIRVEAGLEGDDVKLRLQGVEPLEKAAAGAVQGLQIFVRDALPVSSIAKRLQAGGKAPVVVTLITETGREIDISLGSRFVASPQIIGALKAAPGVVDVVDL